MLGAPGLALAPSDGMTVARRLESERVHMTSRRTQNRRALLRPSAYVNQVVLYAPGVAQLHCPGIDLYAFVTEVTHHHLYGRDAEHESEFSKFFEVFHSLVARALNTHFGRGENFWSQPDSWANTELHRLVDLTEKLLYLWVQPVKDGLCATPDAWSGVLTLPEDLGTTLTVPRPDGAFFGGRRPAGHEPTWEPARREARRRQRKQRRLDKQRRETLRKQRGKRRPRTGHLEADRQARERLEQEPERAARDRTSLPDEVTVTISVPEGFEDWPIESVRSYFRGLLDARVAEIHAEREAEGWGGFMGVAAVEALDPRKSVGDTFPTFALNPRLACKGDPGLLRELKADLLRWRGQYREALEAWCEGRRTVDFPAGAYWLPRFHGAPVVAPRSPPVPWGAPGQPL